RSRHGSPSSDWTWLQKNCRRRKGSPNSSRPRSTSGGRSSRPPTSRANDMKRCLLAGVLAILALGAAAHADDSPTKPITVIVPFPAGGPTDSIIRNLGERMRVSLGQPVVVEYVSGAGGTVGTARAARAAPDGYTIICGHVGTHVTNGAVYSLPFDLVKDFAPISLLPSNPYLIVVNKGLPAGNLKEFMAYVKANPGKVNMGHPGVGTGPH